MAGTAQGDRAAVTRVACRSRYRPSPPGLDSGPSSRPLRRRSGVELSPINLRDRGDTERAVAAFARGPNGGLIVTVSAFATIHRDLIITLAARHKLPAVYPYRFFVAAGGLISYGPDLIDQYRRAASYVDRILKGEKPADLPVQAPTKFELVINLKTAKALGLDRAADPARSRRRGDRIASCLLRCIWPLLMLWTAPPPGT